MIILALRRCFGFKNIILHYKLMVMKTIVRILWLGFFLLFANMTAIAQLYVGPSNFVYVNDRVLYAKDYVSVDNNSNIYLRNGAQLVQGIAGTSTNRGTGKLSVFQEGTVDNFEHSYWCSPVGLATNAVTGNESFGITLLGVPTTKTDTTPALFTSAYDGTAAPLTISQYWINTFITNTVYAGWTAVGTASTINPGQGFSMKGTSGTDTAFYEGTVPNNPGGAQRYDFRGKPNSGNIPITVATGKYTLTGNPYPSAMNLRKFLTIAENPSAVNCTGIAYFWEMDKSVNSHYLEDYRGGYGAYAAGTGIYQKPTYFASDASGNPIAGSYGEGNDYPREFSPIGQGFMIEGTANSSVIMQDKFRVYKKEGIDSHFDKTGSTDSNSSVSPHFRVNTKLGNFGVRQITMAFHPDATDGIDHAMDAEDYGNAVDVYFVIDNRDFIIETVNFDINKRIPVGFRNNVPVSFKMKVAELVNFDESQNIFLYNKTDHTYHNIKTDLYEITLPAGENRTQFEITFTDEALDTQKPDAGIFDVVQNNNRQQLSISNDNLLELQSVSLYDINGKLIFDKKESEIKSKYQFSTAGIATGVYIVKVTQPNDRKYTKKITVYNDK